MSRPVVREVLAGTVGFLVFMGASSVFFYIAGYDPYAPVARTFQVMSVAYGVVIALISGYITALLSPGSHVRPPAIVALVLAVLAIMSLLATDGIEAWSQLSALLLMAPAIMVGGHLRSRNRSREGDDV